MGLKRETTYYEAAAEAARGGHAAPHDADLIQELKQQWLAVEPPHERTHTPKLATAAMKKHTRKTDTAGRSQWE
ncbi:hypothetical protein PGQ11_006136 [Apiospora arundinis]|uniref:Uncharacterized protein n=1 Tax=Apiospora arundinis TaxID=335852 RepID=A0ABR2ISB0_9PEZI